MAKKKNSLESWLFTLAKGRETEKKTRASILERIDEKKRKEDEERPSRKGETSRVSRAGEGRGRERRTPPQEEASFEREFSPERGWAKPKKAVRQTEEKEKDMRYEGEEYDLPEEVEPRSEEEIPDAERSSPSFFQKLSTPFSSLKERRELMKEGKLAFLPFDLFGSKEKTLKGETAPREEILTHWSQKPFKFSTENPILTLIIFLLLTLFFFLSAVSVKIEADSYPPYSMEHKLNIKGEMEVYLPEGHEATDDLNEVRKYWSTDMIVIYVEIEDPGDFPLNITEAAVLREISYIEETLDWNKQDRGVEDDAIFALSISTIVKEVNSTPPRLYDSVLNNTADFIESLTNVRVPYEIISGAVDINTTGDYAIPNQQERIDSYVENMPENLRKKLVADTNEDGIWDAAVIVIGISEEVEPGEMLKKVDSVIESRPNKQTNMVTTGPVPLTDFITNESFRYYGEVMPIACFFVVLGIMFFHRSFKAVLIAGGPTGCAVIWIYGFIGLTNMEVTPTVIVLGPILLALGVSYGLHLANRIAQEPDDDPVVRAQKALSTTGKAVLMSAITTMIGFGALAFGSLMPVTTVGLTLTIGILFCFILSMFMSPAVAILVNYRKKASEALFVKAAKIPTRHPKTIIAIFIVALLVSLSVLSQVETDTNLIKMAPDDPSIRGFDKIRTIITYSEKFDSGALGMTLIESTPGQAFRSDEYEDDSKNPVALLDEVGVIEDDINRIVEDHPDLPVNAISIVTIMKTIGAGGTISLKGLWDDYVPIIPFPFPDEVGEINLSNSANFWELLHSPAVMQNRGVQKYLLNVFYDALSRESRGMVINQFLDPNKADYYTKTLIYVDMPVLTDKETHEAVVLVNEITEESYIYVRPTKLTGVAAVAVAVNDLLIESQQTTLILSILFVFITLSVIFKEKGSKWPNFKLGGLTTLPVVIVVCLEPLVMIMADVSLNLATVMIGSTVIGAGVDFSVHITQRTQERGMNIKSVENSVEKSGMALVEATIITVLGLCAAFWIPIAAIYNFVLVIMILLALSAVAAMFLLPAIYVMIIGRKKGEDDLTDLY